VEFVINSCVVYNIVVKLKNIDMKAKISICSFIFLFAAILVHGQNYNLLSESNQNQSVLLQSESEKNDWSEYNVFFSETFDSTEWHSAQADGVAIPGNMPNGWSVVDNTGNNYFWRWSTTGARGRYTSPAEGADALVVPNNDARVKSHGDAHGAEKGFLLLECDLFNTTPEGEMMESPIDMDTYIQFGPIDLSSATYVCLYFEQYHRFCCNPYGANSGAKLLVSVDGNNWTQFSVEQASVNATPKVNPSIIDMSVSDIAAGQSTVYFRFHLMNESHYYWSIDDVYIFEPLQYNLRINNYWVDYYRQSEGQGYATKFSEPPFFNPYYSFQKLQTAHAKIYNSGWDTLKNVVLTSKVYKENEVVFEASSEPEEFLGFSILHSLEVDLNYQIPNSAESIGKYSYGGEVTYDEQDEENLGITEFAEFNITSNLYGYLNPENADSDRGTHLVSYSSGEGDGIGFITLLNPSPEYVSGTTIPAPYDLQGLNVYILDNPYNYTLWRTGDVANFKVEVYLGTLDGSEYSYDLESPLASSALTPIDSTFASKWLYIPFQTEDGANIITPPAAGTQYLVLLRMYTNDRSFYIGAERRSKYSFYSQFCTVDNDVYEGPGYMNYAMELLINNYGENPSTDIQFSVATNTNQEGTSPATGAEVVFYTTSDENTLVENTITIDNSGVALFEDMRSGTYSYKVSYQGEVFEGSVTAYGQDITKEVNFNFVGLDTPALSESWKLYPNPAQSFVTIEMDEEVKQIIITNIMGQEVFVMTDPKEQVNVDISSLDTGIYLVWITTENRLKTTKMFVKQ